MLRNCISLSGKNTVSERNPKTKYNQTFWSNSCNLLSLTKLHLPLRRQPWDDRKDIMYVQDLVTSLIVRQDLLQSIDAYVLFSMERLFSHSSPSLYYWVRYFTKLGAKCLLLWQPMHIFYINFPNRSFMLLKNSTRKYLCPGGIIYLSSFIWIHFLWTTMKSFIQITH